MNIDLGNVTHAAGLVVVLGIAILVLTFLLPILGELIVLAGLAAVAYIVYRFLKLNGKI